MRKIMLTALVAVVAIVSVNAQSFGVKAGLNQASLSGDGTGGLDGRTSFHVGVVAEFKISEKFSFQPELMYSSQGFEASESDIFSDVGIHYNVVSKLEYLNIPLIAKYYVANGLSIEAGPQVGFLLSGKYDWEGEDDNHSESGSDDINNIKDFDFGLNFGLGYKLDSGLNFGARYNVGLFNINDNNDSSNKNGNSVFQLSVGYFF